MQCGRLPTSHQHHRNAHQCIGATTSKQINLNELGQWGSSPAFAGSSCTVVSTGTEIWATGHC